MSCVVSYRGEAIFATQANKVQGAFVSSFPQFLRAKRLLSPCFARLRFMHGAVVIVDRINSIP